MSATSKLIKRLDDLTRKIVLARDKRCVVCGSTQGLQNGHYIRRGVWRWRWDLENCNAQCSVCNARHEEDEEPYRRAMVARYGLETVEGLEAPIHGDGKVAYGEMLVLCDRLKHHLRRMQ